MLVTISHITAHIKSAKLALNEAEDQIANGDAAQAASYALISEAYSKLAITLMYARATTILAAGNDPDQAPLPFE